MFSVFLITCPSSDPLTWICSHFSFIFVFFPTETSKKGCLSPDLFLFKVLKISFLEFKPSSAWTLLLHFTNTLSFLFRCGLRIMIATGVRIFSIFCIIAGSEPLQAGSGNFNIQIVCWNKVSAVAAFFHRRTEDYNFHVLFAFIVGPIKPTKTR